MSCTDGTDTTFFNLTLLFTTKDPDVTDKPDTSTLVAKSISQSDTILIIIGAFIGGLFLIMVIIVICVRKWQDKNNDEHMANEKTFFNIDGSSEGATPNQYSIEEWSDAIPHDNYGYVEMDVAKCWYGEVVKVDKLHLLWKREMLKNNQAHLKAVDIKRNRDKWHFSREFTFLNRL